MCFDSSEVKGSVLTKQHEQKSSTENTVHEASPFSDVSGPGPSARVDLFGGRGEKENDNNNKKYNVQRPNGRLMLFVPV